MTTTTNNSSKNTGQTNKKRSSSKTNDKTSTQRISTHHHHHHHRCNSRPRSGSSSLPTTPTSSTSSSQDHRRPSTKQPLPVSEATPPPRLSIADRFMSPTFSLSNTSSTTTALSNSALSNSALSDVQSKLSVADRFMSSPTTTTSSNSTSKKIIANTRHSSPNMDPVPGKLTIAETFMRQSRSRAQSVGEMDLGVVGNNQKESKITPSSSVSTTTGTLSTTTTNRIHPLDSTQKSPPTTATTTKTRTSTSIHFFDDDQLNLDLSLPTNSLNKEEDKGRRPFGSQDTLVPKNDDKNNKNKIRTETKQKKIIPIYAQFIESEKNTFLSSSSLSQHISQDEDERYSFLMDDYYSDHQHRERRDTAITIVASEEDEEEKKGQFEKKYNHDHLSEKWQYDHADEEAVVRKYDEAIRYKSRKLEQEEDDDDVKPNGFWIGCCFITCGKRPSQAMLKQKENKRRRKRKESDESEEEEQLYNNNEHRKTNKTNKDDKKKKQKRICCSRRGWVFSIFLGVLITALIIYLLFPRTPLMRIEGAKLVTPAKITQTKQGSAMMTNVAFESQWLVNVTVDNRQNHVPTRLTKIQVLAKDALTGLVIGKGVQENEQSTEYVLPPNSISTIQLPIHVDYQARDSTDTTFVDLTKSCQNASTHEVLPLHFWMTLHFFGLDWLGYKPTLIATPATGGFVCPLS